LNSGRGNVSDELATIILCERMHWDYFTYLEQPDWFIAGLRKKSNLDAEYQQRLAKISKRKYGNK